MSTTTRVRLQGPYDLREVALMGFGHRDEQDFDGVMRLGFCLDSELETQVGVALRQEGSELVVELADAAGPAPDPDHVVRQATRVVSADHDARPYAELCRADPMLAEVFARRRVFEGACADGGRPARQNLVRSAAPCGSRLLLEQVADFSEQQLFLAGGRRCGGFFLFLAL